MTDMTIDAAKNANVGRVFDCVLYNGEIDMLELRLNELSKVVDIFVIVESTHTFSGQIKTESLLDQWERVRPFARQIRYVVVTDLLRAPGPWQRETLQRNSCLHGLADIQPADLILLSDVDELPRAEVIAQIRADEAHHIFGFELSFRYFSLDYCNVSGPESNITWTVAFRPDALHTHSPEQLRYAVRKREVVGKILKNAGWHFSYLSDEAGIRRKIRAFSHQEFNTSEFLDTIDIPTLIRTRGDLFGRKGFVWDIADRSTLPQHVLNNPEKYVGMLLGEAAANNNRALKERYQKKATAGNKIRRFFRKGKSVENKIEPIIICPYVKTEHKNRVVAAFGLDQSRGKRLPFFFWQDNDLIGPEAAFQHCWSQFPDRDVIIMHTDMAPMPDDLGNSWYEKLLEYVKQLPDAGAIACDLLFPHKTERGHWAIQCAGGIFTAEGQISHIGGRGVDVDYDDQYVDVRRAEWVTFGGVYLRRAALDTCGSFDTQYQWAYVMDVDYSVEMRLRGWNLYQVPVNLHHDASTTTRPMLEQPEYQAKVQANAELFYRKWKDLLASGRLSLQSTAG